MKIRLLCLVLLISNIAFSQVNFLENIVNDNIDAPNEPFFVFAADLDGDGDMDIISSQRYDNKIVWYENTDGLGNFGTQKMISVEVDAPEGVYAFDLDNDNDMDIISASSNDNKVAWYENDGQGNFSTQKIITTNADEVRRLHIVDIDNDGDLDVFAKIGTYPGLEWFKNDGSGNFGSRIQIFQNPNGAGEVDSIDMDGDGDLDIVTGSSSSIVWHENLDGLGDFGTSINISSSYDRITGIGFADFNGDNEFDIAATDAGSVDAVTWFALNSIQGQRVSITNPTSLKVLDVDGDGDQDMIAGTSRGIGIFDNLSWYENTDGQGNMVKRTISDQLWGVQSIFTTDIDNDGHIDIISASSRDNTILWFKGDGAGNFTRKQVITPNENNISNAISCDLDGDGDLDILAGSLNKVSWYENTDGNGTMSDQKIINETFGNITSSVYPADFDGDGDLDVFYTTPDHLFAWRENINGNFGSETIVQANANYRYIFDFFIVDINADNALDIIVRAAQINSGSGSQVYMFKNDGSGGFGIEEQISQDVDFVDIGDFDSDNDIDILITSETNNTKSVSVLKNTDGQGTFDYSDPYISYGTTGRFWSAQTADIDGDNDLDYIISDFLKVIFVENMGGGDFQIKQELDPDDSFREYIQIGDLDNDGDNDVLTGSYGENFISWYENTDGNGTFGVRQFISSNTHRVNDISLSDIDADGDLDILSASYSDSKIVWFRNDGVTRNEIRGIVRFDSNGDGNCDITDSVLPNIKVVTKNATDSLATFTLNNGLFQLFPDTGTYTTNLIAAIPQYYVISPTDHISSFSNVGNTDVVDFCIKPIGPVNDLEIVIVPLDDARPGFDSEYKIIFSNVGTTTLSGDVALEFDNTKMTFLDAIPAADAQSPNTVTFNYTDLKPLERKTIKLKFNVLPPPTVEIDDVLTFVATINPVNDDETEETNVYTLDQVVVGSYDPNDILVLEGPEIFYDELENYLHYTIRFQNTGNYFATMVRIENTIEDTLDWGTFQLLDASHENTTTIKNGNNVTFNFDRIYLPDSTNDEPNSHGYVTYRIKPKNDLIIGDIISNTAAIYFDFNPPIITNTVTTTIVERQDTGSGDNGSLNFSAYPVPVTNTLNIDADGVISKIEIYSRIGQLLITKMATNEVNISNLSNGLYFVKVTSNEGKSSVKKILKI